MLITVTAEHKDKHLVADLDCENDLYFEHSMYHHPDSYPMWKIGKHFVAQNTLNAKGEQLVDVFDDGVLIWKDGESRLVDESAFPSINLAHIRYHAARCRADLKLLVGGPWSDDRIRVSLNPKNSEWGTAGSDDALHVCCVTEKQWYQFRCWAFLEDYMLNAESVSLLKVPPHKNTKVFPQRRVPLNLTGCTAIPTADDMTAEELGYVA